MPCDVIGRYKRMTGYNVLHAMGWDAFGLPAENDALLKKLHPKETVPRYAANFKRQLKLSGCAYDWTREINSSTPEYYKWTQWFFLLLYKRGLAYRAVGSQWWCDKCRTILANEQVVDGCCWRHPDTPVTKKDLEQWYFRITAYADRLLADLDGHRLARADQADAAQLDRPFRGRRARLPGQPVIRTRKCAFSPPGPIPCSASRSWCWRPSIRWSRRSPRREQRAAVDDYVAEARRQSEIERLSTVKEKTGVFTGAYARNIFTNEDIPIWIADYVLMGYGTGAIMAAPGEDQRDFEFAKKYDLKIPRVTAPLDGSEPPPDRAFTEYGIAINSGFLTGMTTAEAIRPRSLVRPGKRNRAATISYRMRDWLISRQRYWGCPIPIVYCKRDCGIVPVPEEQLPVMLPDMKDYQPSGTGRSPLANVPEFVNTTCPRVRRSRRARDRYDGRLCLLVVVFSAFRLAALRPRPVRRAAPSTTGCRSTFMSAAPSTP